MNLILRWILNQLAGIMGGCYTMTQSMATTGFQNPAVKALLSVFHLVGLPLFAIALLVLLGKAAIDVGDNKQVSFIDMIKRFTFGAVIYQFAVPIMQQLYLKLLNIGSDILVILSGHTEIKLSTWDLTGALGSQSLVAILLIIAVFYMLKTILNLLERFWLLLVTLIMLYLYLPGFVAGNDEGILMWFKSCVGIGLTQLIQTYIIVFGMTLFAAGGSPTEFGLTIGAIIAASKVDTLMDKWGQSAGGKVGNLARNSMSSVFYAKQLIGGSKFLGGR